MAGKPIRSYRDIEAYQRAKALVPLIHKLSRSRFEGQAPPGAAPFGTWACLTPRKSGLLKLVESFPPHERFDLCDQMRRASKSVAANIVEGYSHKDTPAKARQFWRNAIGSANEMIEHLETAIALQYVSQELCQPTIAEYTIVAKQLNRLIQNWQVF